MLANDLGVNPSWLMLAFIKANQDFGGYGGQALGSTASALVMACGIWPMAA